MALLGAAAACVGGGSGGASLPSFTVVGLAQGEALPICFGDPARTAVGRGALELRNDADEPATILLQTDLGAVAARVELAPREQRAIDVEVVGPASVLAIGAFRPANDHLGRPAELGVPIQIPLLLTVDDALITVEPLQPHAVHAQEIEIAIRNAAPAPARVTLTVDGPFEPSATELTVLGSQVARFRMSPGGATGEQLGGSVRVAGPSCAGVPARPRAPIAITGRRSESVVEICAGDEHTCVRTRGGGVFCFGDNRSGQLAQPPSALPAGYSAEPLAVVGVSRATSLSCGRAHACAVQGGTVSCWGDCDNGQCGPSIIGVSASPVSVPLDGPALRVFSGVDATCAALSNGGLACWGVSVSGEPRVAPQIVPQIVDVKRAALGKSHVCAIDGVDDLRCWGAGGRIGDGTDDPAAEPKVVGQGFTLIAAGDDFTCGLTRANMNSPFDEVFCWGDIPQGGTVVRESSPSPIWSGLSVGDPQLSARARSFCAAMTEIQCGGDDVGQPLHSPSLALAVGREHHCSIFDAGFLVCSGSTARGQAGIGRGRPIGWFGGI